MKKRGRSLTASAKYWKDTKRCLDCGSLVTGQNSNFGCLRCSWCGNLFWVGEVDIAEDSA